MTTVAIIGRGRGATLHAETIRMTRGVELVGVAGRAHGPTGALSEALGVRERPLRELVAAAEAVIVAVPPRAVAAVLSEIPADRPTLVESPVGPLDLDTTARSALDRPRSMVAVNLLHAPTVRRGLRAITELREVHHLVLRSRTPPPANPVADGGTGVLLEPMAQLVPVLLAAAGEPVAAVSARVDRDDRGIDVAARLELRLADGRTVLADLAWADSSAHADVEAASDHGVVALTLWPRPSLEVDGNAVADSGEEHPLVALGFVDQLQRLLAVTHGAAPWPSLSVGLAALDVAIAAADSGPQGRFPPPS